MKQGPVDRRVIARLAQIPAGRPAEPKRSPGERTIGLREPDPEARPIASPEPDLERLI